MPILPHLAWNRFDVFPRESVRFGNIVPRKIFVSCGCGRCPWFFASILVEIAVWKIVRRQQPESSVSRSAALVLEDGTVFHGRSVGLRGTAVGEMVFNTSLTGYQEILTDPSYSRQIVVFTCPHIGNVGTSTDDNESGSIHAAGLVVRSLSRYSSSWRNVLPLNERLKRQGVVGISDVDTRALTRLLRTKGTQNGCIFVPKLCPVQVAQKKAQDFSVCSTRLLRRDDAPRIRRSTTHPKQPSPTYHVGVCDFGVKTSMLRMLRARRCRLSMFAPNDSAERILSNQVDGIFLSNGPGDPQRYRRAIANTRTFLSEEVPIFGICLGHQLLSLANGAKIVRMKFGHHGSNHPVVDLQTKRILTTVQNHAFAVDGCTLPLCLRVTHVSLMDHTLQGVVHTTRPAFGFQGHPEAHPGPHDAVSLFDRFVRLMQRRR